MASKDDALYGRKKQRLMKGRDEISNTADGSSFASQLSSLINSKSKDDSKARSSKARSTKEDIFTAHHRNAAAKKKARKLADEQQPFGQQHTVDGEGLDHTIFERSKRKMEDKARLYAAMKRGDVEDMDEKYAVDFDRKWAEGEDEQDEDLSGDQDEEEEIEWTDEFGRQRKGTKTQRDRLARQENSRVALTGDRFTARPNAPANIIYGDAIQHEAFDPDAPMKAQMEALAAKRDRSLTPPPDEHFDSSREMRLKGTAFFQFSADNEERKRQMEALEDDRILTEQKRKERQDRLRREVIERDREFQEDDDAARRKRKADDFLSELDAEMRAKSTQQDLDPMQRMEAALNSGQDLS